MSHRTFLNILWWVNDRLSSQSPPHQSLPLTREVAARRADGGRENIHILSPSHSFAVPAPSSEGALDDARDDRLEGADRGPSRAPTPTKVDDRLFCRLPDIRVILSTATQWRRRRIRIQKVPKLHAFFHRRTDSSTPLRFAQNDMRFRRMLSEW